jgi:bisphosphoglycerate-dependent phosphoglycerate mutase
VGHQGLWRAAWLAVLEPERSWVHYAFYEFADVGQAQALIGSEKIKPLVADFDRVWGDRVKRTREVLEIVQEAAP